MYNNFYPQMNQQYAQPMEPQVNSELVSVRSEAEARNYPVKYGSSVMFKDENSPHIYVKIMGFSQLEQPKFEKYKLIKEEPEEQVKTEISYAEKSELEALRKELDALKESIGKKAKKDE